MDVLIGYIKLLQCCGDRAVNLRLLVLITKFGFLLKFFLLLLEVFPPPLPVSKETGYPPDDVQLNHRGVPHLYPHKNFGYRISK
jgi:hypothetical protein